MKKGQTTLFVVIGIVIVVLVGMGIFFRNELTETFMQTEFEESVNLPIEVNQFKEEFQQCLSIKFHNSILDFGLYGGYNSPLKNSLEIDSERVNYGLIDGKNNIREIERIEKDLGDYMKKEISDCVFSEKLDLDLKKIEFDISLNEEESVMVADYAVDIKFLDSNYIVTGPYEFVKGFRLKKLNQIAYDVVQQKLIDPENIDVLYLLDTNMDVKILNVEEGSVVYILKDLEGEEDYSFFFALEEGL